MVEPTGGAELLSMGEVIAAERAATMELGLHLLGPEAEEAIVITALFGPARIYGGSGDNFDVFQLTEAWVGEGILRVQCVVPVLIPEDRLEQVLELCLGLNTQGRVAFALGRRGTPVVVMTVRVIASASDQAAQLFMNCLKMTWQRAEASEQLFRAVVDGADARSVLLALDSLVLPLILGPSPGHGPRGTQWRVLDNASRELDEYHAVEGHTEAETRASIWTISRLEPSTEAVDVDACGGPLLFHADGVAECYGCEEPASPQHLAECWLSCKAGMDLGRGYRCERCSQPA